MPLKIDYDFEKNLVLWAAVDSTHDLVPAVVTIVGTGNELPPDAGVYVSTIFMGGPFVFHMFYREIGA